MEAAGGADGRCFVGMGRLGSQDRTGSEGEGGVRRDDEGKLTRRISSLTERPLYDTAPPTHAPFATRAPHFPNQSSYYYQSSSLDNLVSPQLTLSLPSLSLSAHHHRRPAPSLAPSLTPSLASVASSSTCCASEQQKLSRDFFPISVRKLLAVLVRFMLIRGLTR